MPDDLRGLDLEILQLVIGDRDVARSLELVSFVDAVTIDDLASLAVDKLLRRPGRRSRVKLIEPVCPQELRCD
jgi:hypothetical protein